MDSELKGKWLLVSRIWLSLSILSAFAAGYLFALSLNWWIPLIFISILSCVIHVRRMTGWYKRLRYVMDATLEGDFSYLFPTERVSREERVVNETLNLMVRHFERLTVESRKNELFLKRVIGLTDVGIAVADADGYIVLNNESASRLLERPVITHVRHLPKDSTDDLLIRKFRLTSGNESYSIFSIHDLRHLRQMAEVESWEKLTRVLTHEIMNSLTPVQSIAESMLAQGTGGEYANAFAVISSSSRSLMQFVRNFREFTKLPETQPRPIYLRPLLESCIKMGEEYAKGRNIRFSLLCFPPDVMVYTDEMLLSRVLLNIIKNAIEANPTDIHIDADLKADESVDIRISNDGDPIHEEMADKIFTPFFTTRKEGSGIGLSLSRRIIAHLGGTLTLLRSDTRVTTFSIRL